MRAAGVHEHGGQPGQEAEADRESDHQLEQRKALLCAPVHGFTTVRTGTTTSVKTTRRRASLAPYSVVAHVSADATVGAIPCHATLTRITPVAALRVMQPRAPRSPPTFAPPAVTVSAAPCSRSFQAVRSASARVFGSPVMAASAEAGATVCP